jgi:outer membrane protein TolC
VAEVAEARHALGVLKDTEDDLRVDLNDLLGLPLETVVDLSDPIEGALPSEAESKMPDAPSAGTPPYAGTAATALAHNPEVASARSTLDKANAGLQAARLEFIPDVSLFAEHVYQNGVPLLPANSATFGLRLDWTLSEFGKRTGKVRERQSQVAQAKENLNLTQGHIRIDVEKQLRKIHRGLSAVEAAQANVAARIEMRRIVSDQVEAKTANSSALANAEAELAEAQARLFDARVESVTARAELDKLLGDASNALVTNKN